MLIKEMPFARPFIVKMQCGLERIFLNAYDALDFLENEWPMRKGPFHEQAKQACRDALSGTGSILAARAALIAACSEAGFVPLADAEQNPQTSIQAA